MEIVDWMAFEVRLGKVNTTKSNCTAFWGVDGGCGSIRRRVATIVAFAQALNRNQSEMRWCGQYVVKGARSANIISTLGRGRIWVGLEEDS